MTTAADRPPAAIAPPIVGPSHAILARRPWTFVGPPDVGPVHGEYLAENYSDPATGDEWQVITEWWRRDSDEAARWAGRVDPCFPHFVVTQKIVFFEGDRPVRVVRPSAD